MKIIVFGCEGEDETASRICRRYPDQFRQFTEIEKERNLHRFEPEEGDILVRYGFNSFPSLDEKFDKVYNPAEAIQRNVQKDKSMAIMGEAGVRVPDVFYSKKEARHHYLLLGRQFQHARGEDIVLIRNSDDLIDDEVSQFWVKMIEPTQYEFRFHVFKDKVIRKSMKVRKTHLEEGEVFNPVIRNHHRGWDFTQQFYWPEPKSSKPVCVEESIKAVKSLGLDFGAVDLLLDGENKPWILEVNTGPRMDKGGRYLFVKSLLEDLRVGEE